MPSPEQANPRKSLKARVAAGLLLILVVAVATVGSLGTKRQPPARDSEPRDAHVAGIAGGSVYTPPSDDGYVGSGACVECHSAIADAYQSHPMARSITPIDAASPDAVAPPDAARVDGKTRYFQVEMREGQMLHHERMADADGNLIYDQAIPMNFVVGSGKRARAYLFQEGQVLFMSPLNWYSQAQRWDLAPGYVPDDPRRFDRRITDECLSCHAGRVASAGRSLNTYRQPPFHEMAIGCESCHGPGGQHVAVRSSGQLVTVGADPIVNPSRLDASRRESVCNQCHLQAAVRLTRPGRSDLDFRPGQNLDEVWTYLDIKRQITADGRTHSVNHVQQMRESRCFTQSDGRLGCTSCHDPHRVPTKETQVHFYRDKCLKCHNESSCVETAEHRQQQKDSCIACHMPARLSSNISHVTQTDHRVIRSKAGVASEHVGDETDMLAFFDDQNNRLTPLEQNRAIGLGAWARLTKTGRRPSPDLGLFLNQTLTEMPDDGLLLIALGTMAHQGKRLDLARGYLERARQIPAAEEAAVAELLDIYYESSDWEQALRCANRLIEINPRETKAYALKADALSVLGKSTDGIAAARKAIELNPSLISVRRWLVKAYRIAGREGDAVTEESIIDKIEKASPLGRD